jgi:hypothetical protein
MFVHVSLTEGIPQSTRGGARLRDTDRRHCRWRVTRRWRRAKRGSSFRPATPRFADAIDALVSDAELRARIVAAGRTLVRDLTLKRGARVANFITGDRQPT